MYTNAIDLNKEQLWDILIEWPNFERIINSLKLWVCKITLAVQMSRHYIILKLLPFKFSLTFSDYFKKKICYVFYTSLLLTNNWFPSHLQVSISSYKLETFSYLVYFYGELSYVASDRIYFPLKLIVVNTFSLYYFKTLGGKCKEKDNCFSFP